MGVLEMAEELLRTKEDKKAAQEKLRALEQREEKLEKELYQLFTAEKLEEIPVNGYTLKPVLKFTATAKNDKTIRVVRRRGYGYLVKPTIHPSTAHAFIRQQSALNGCTVPDWITANFNITEKETISVRRE